VPDGISSLEVVAGIPAVPSNAGLMVSDIMPRFWSSGGSAVVLPAEDSAVSDSTPSLELFAGISVVLGAGGVVVSENPE